EQESGACQLNASRVAARRSPSGSASLLRCQRYRLAMGGHHERYSAMPSGSRPTNGPFDPQVEDHHWIGVLSMFARVAFVTCFALLFLWSVTNGEEASRGIEIGPAVSDTVSKAQSMAQRELEIGRYYMSRGNYPGAINRFKIVLERFPSTS